LFPDLEFLTLQVGPSVKPTAQELDQLWSDLASSDAGRAGRAMAQLEAVADPTVDVVWPMR
jgi:hypothetical protein